MRKLSRYIVGIGAMISALSCSEEKPIIQHNEEVIEITFHPSLEGDSPTRAIGDAEKIDQLRAVVYEDSPEGLNLTQSITASWDEVRRKGISLKVSGNKTYKVLFWAEDKDNTAYHFKEDGIVAADYSDYYNGGFSKMEELDVFYTTSDITPGTETGKAEKVVLRRPVAMLNFADKTAPVEGIHTVKVTFHSIPTSFDPFTGSVKATDHMDSSDDIVFTFTDFPNEVLDADGSTYSYLTCNYLLAPVGDVAEAACTIELTKEGVLIDKSEFTGKKSITLKQNKKSNVVIPMMQSDREWSEWNGMFPIGSTITVAPDDPDCYIIDDAEDLAWLSDSSHKNLLEKGKTFRLTVDIDMGNKPGQMSLKLPDGSSFDGNGHTIKGLKLMVGLFGNRATDLSVKDLTIDGAQVISTTNNNIGILVNNLYGSATFSNVSILNSSVKTIDGSAAGMVGYISRKSKSDRSEKLDIVFDNCHIINTSIESAASEGHFVGMFRGYDKGETLTFKSSCTVIPPVGSEELNSKYIDGNEGIWLAEHDYSAYDAWLGTEECYRGIILYGETRFIPRWDGETYVRPLDADPEYDSTPECEVTAGYRRLMIYSAFDLAGARSKVSPSLNALYFMEDVDLNGPGEDGVTDIPDEFSYSAAKSTDDNYFTTLSRVDYLDGQNHTIYNMNIRPSTSASGAFIRSTAKTAHTIHKDLKFDNCTTVVPVRTVVNEDGRSEDHSIGSILIVQPVPDITSGEGSYVMENIHIYNSSVFALQSIGIIASNFRGEMRNCSVNDCYIENYKCENSLEKFEETMSIGGGTVKVRADFYSYGEVGGLIGELQNESSVTDCHVRRTTIRAYGEQDKEAEITGEGVIGNLAATTAKGMGYLLVPGRHVSTLIGDIRTLYGETIRITGCTVDEETQCKPKQDKHNNEIDFIGQAYFIPFLDTEGTVIVDGKKLTLADGKRTTIR